jgi:hypothetical protein
VIKASNNFSQSAYEDAFNRGALKSGLNSREGNVLKGLAGEAVVIDSLRRDNAKYYLNTVVSLVISQPLSSPGLRPDILNIHSPLTLKGDKVQAQLNRVLVNSDGQTGSVSLPTSVLQVYYEVKAGFTERHIPTGAEQVESLSLALRATGGAGVAVLAVDRSAWTKLSPQRRQDIFDRVTQAGAYIQIWDGLAIQSVERARAVIKETKTK